MPLLTSLLERQQNKIIFLTAKAIVQLKRIRPVSPVILLSALDKCIGEELANTTV